MLQHCIIHDNFKRFREWGPLEELKEKIIGRKMVYSKI